MKLSDFKHSIIVAAIPVVLAAAGCQKKAADGVPTASVTDLAVPAPAPMASYTPAPVQPVYDSAPAAPTPASFASNTYGAAGTGGDSSAIGGGTYKVKKGDTLFAIARAKYGDGKQWTKIASANPGVSPQSLKVGQTLIVP